ncbi:hypothetical protein Godav_022728 [Gossypium davidsonii]|uniref:Uncharacterized protein n=1 Tax=Gossypium davidsonii TaxID=34287 RepID=A0A7J8SPW8_GOSDV|nr:hypothetical protein [Gossypium davidsonii]
MECTRSSIMEHHWRPMQWNCS